MGMNEVLLSLYKLAAVYKYVLKYKADFQQAISIILVKATSMQWGAEYVHMLGKSLGKADLVKGVADVEVLGSMLIADFDEFKAINALRFRTETAAQLSLEACQINVFEVSAMIGGSTTQTRPQRTKRHVLMPALIQGYSSLQGAVVGVVSEVGACAWR